MALIAKEVIMDGWDTVAVPGSVVSPATVERLGCQDKVEEDGTVLQSADESDTGEPAAKRSRTPK